MKIGYRVAFKEEVGAHRADLVQISYWKRFGPTLKQVEETAARCRELDVPYVIHPVFTPLSETRPEYRKQNLEELTRLARLTDLGLIVHDETMAGGERLTGEQLIQYEETLAYLRTLCPVSLENATNTLDIDWFWNQLTGAITIDLGHFEASGIDSVERMVSFTEDLLSRVDYVHMHRNNGKHGDGSITDHWPLTESCPEVEALKALLHRKKDLSVILEVNELDQMGKSLSILSQLRNSLDERSIRSDIQT